MAKVVRDNNLGQGFSRYADGATMDVRFIVTGLSAGADPTTAVDDTSGDAVLQPGETFIFGGVKMFVDTTSVSRVIRQDENYEVTARLSTNGRYQLPSQPDRVTEPDYKTWGGTFTKTQIRAPFWKPAIIPYTGADGLPLSFGGHELQFSTIDLEFEVLNRACNYVGLTDSQILGFMTATREQFGKLHFFDNRWWLFRPAPYQVRGDVLTVFYTWENDPGNGESGLSYNEFGVDSVPAPERPGFGDYIWTAGDPFNGTDPTIRVFERFPAVTSGGDPNPYVDADGWQLLPGSPLG